MANYFDVIIWALVGGLFSLAGGLLLLSRAKLAFGLARYASPFAAGALLGAVFFDLFPEAVELKAESTVFLFALVGIITFFILEHYLHWFHHHHSHEGSIASTPTIPLIIIGDTLHNAIDGVIIGAAFLINVPVGIATAIAIAAHEIPQEIGDLGILLKAGMKRRRALLWNAASALATLATAVLTFWLGGSDYLPLPAILGLAAGMFTYIAASDLIPTIHTEAKGKFAHLSVLLLIAGAFSVWAVTEYSHQQLHQATESHQEAAHGHAEDSHEE